MFCSTDKSCRTNRALLVSVTDFYPGVALSRRPGAKKDTKRLHNVLSKLGFKVLLVNDPTAREMCEMFKAGLYSEQVIEDCFLGVISSHGEEGMVFGADGGIVKLPHIFSMFDSSAMNRKTKLFFIQVSVALQKVDTDSVADEKDKDSFSHCLSIPINTAVGFATSPGYSAFMHPLGSVFLQTLCDLLEKDGGRDLEVTQLLTRLNHCVAYKFQARGRELAGKKEMPCFVSRLTCQLFPFASKQGPQKAKEDSFKCLTDEPRRIRKHSIS
ncbi:caspase-7-like [Scleropages formosus]|uniref:Caspase-7-like n=1 Tax=Scleropages formosus TaxID=113540 RepID=A0A0P7UDE8_SCLFO|nr:caspase-7-like [Scleropages formosus]